MCDLRSPWDFVSRTLDTPPVGAQAASSTPIADTNNTNTNTITALFTASTTAQWCLTYEVPWTS